MHRVNSRFLAAVCAAFALAACGPEIELPPPPAIDVSLYPPAIRTQLGDAYSLVAANPHNATRNGNLAMLLHTYDQAESATLYYQRAMLLDDHAFRWPYLLAWAQSAQGLDNDALATFRTAMNIKPEYARGRIKIAELLLALGRLDECRQELDDLIVRYPERAEAYFLLGQLENQLGQPARAIAAFDTVHNIAGDFGALHYGLAQAYRLLGDKASAARHATLYSQHKDTTVSINDPVLARMEALNISETTLIERAKVFAQQGDNASAETLLNQALATNPDSFAAHITLVGLYATRKQFDKADAELAIASRLDPHHPSLFYNTGIARLAEERWTEAERAFRQCLAIDPKKADAHAQIGLIHEIRGRAQEAEADYRSALTIDPWHRQANWLLGRLLLANGDAPAAINSLERVRSARDPSAPGVLMDLAKAYEHNGQTEQARVAATEAREVANKYQDQRIVNLATGMLARLQQAATTGPGL